MDSPVLTQLESESEVTILEELEEYSHVQFVSVDGNEIWDGYVKSENISANEDLLDTESNHCFSQKNQQ